MGIIRSQESGVRSQESGVIISWVGFGYATYLHFAGRHEKHSAKSGSETQQQLTQK
ncbi:MAG: hypothetical protein F6K39_25585 [Okeania sp. SIO3B3]|nr:hypothetical protein [Okeania sp. SIO3B3]